MGKILVKAPAAVAPLASGLGNVVQDAFKVRTRLGRGIGGALGGLSALTSLADASENQQDLLSGAQMAAGRGVGAYIGAGKVADTASPVIGAKLQDRRDRRNQVGRYNAPRSDYSGDSQSLKKPAPESRGVRGYNEQGERTYTQVQPTFDPTMFDPVDAQQTAMANLSRQNTAMVDAFNAGQKKENQLPVGTVMPGYGNPNPVPIQPGEKYGQEVQLGPYQTMGTNQANQILGGQVGVTPPASPQMSLEEANKKLGPQQPNFQDTEFNVPQNFQLGVYGTPMGGGNQAIPGQKGIQPNMFNPSAPTTSVTPDASDIMSQGSTQSAVDQYVDSLSPEVKELIMNQKTAGEPMELAFRLLKSVMR